MTIIEAAEQGITCLRKPYWEPGVSLELSVNDDGLNVFAGLRYPLPKEERGYVIYPVILAELAFALNALGAITLSEAFTGDDWEEYREK